MAETHSIAEEMRLLEHMAHIWMKANDSLAYIFFYIFAADSMDNDYIFWKYTMSRNKPVFSA